MPTNSDYRQLLGIDDPKPVRGIEGVNGANDAELEDGNREGYTEKEYSALEKAADHSRQKMIVEGLEKALATERANLARLNGELPAIVEVAPPELECVAGDCEFDSWASPNARRSMHTVPSPYFNELMRATFYVTEPSDSTCGVGGGGVGGVGNYAVRPFQLGDYVRHGDEVGSVIAVDNSINYGVTRQSLRVRFSHEERNLLSSEIYLLSANEMRVGRGTEPFRTADVVSVVDGIYQNTLQGQNGVVIQALSPPTGPFSVNRPGQQEVRVRFGDGEYRFLARELVLGNPLNTPSRRNRTFRVGDTVLCGGIRGRVLSFVYGVGSGKVRVLFGGRTEDVEIYRLDPTPRVPIQRVTPARPYLVTDFVTYREKRGQVSGVNRGAVTVRFSDNSMIEVREDSPELRHVIGGAIHFPTTPLESRARIQTATACGARVRLIHRNTIMQTITVAAMTAADFEILVADGSATMDTPYSSTMRWHEGRFEIGISKLKNIGFEYE